MASITSQIGSLQTGVGAGETGYELESYEGGSGTSGGREVPLRMPMTGKLARKRTARSRAILNFVSSMA
jgi:hypothetical protein